MSSSRQSALVRLVFLTAFPLLLSILAVAQPAAAAELVVSPEVVAKTAVQLNLQGIEAHSHDGDTNENAEEDTRGNQVEIWFTRELNPVLAPSFTLPKDEPIASWKVFPDRRGDYSFSYLFWDAGEYEVRVEGESFTVKVSAEEEAASTTIVIYVGLALFGLVAGVIGGWSRGRRNLAASAASGSLVISVMLITLLFLLVPGTVWGHGDDESRISTSELITQDVQGEVGDDALSFPLSYHTHGDLVAGEFVQLRLDADDDHPMVTTIDHVEDGLTMFRGEILPQELEAEISMVFPEGTDYRIQRGLRVGILPIESVQASGAVRAVSLATFLVAFVVPLLLGYFMGRRAGGRKGSDKK